MEGKMKKMKRLPLYITILYFLVLPAVPCYIIYNYYDILSTGETYKIEVTAYDPYDPFRGRYVTINPALPELRWPSGGVRLIKGDDDFVTSAAKDGYAGSYGYVKNFKIERYYMNEKTAPLVEERQRRPFEERDFMYVVIKVKNGKYAIESLYINGIAAEDFVKD